MISGVTNSVVTWLPDWSLKTSLKSSWPFLYLCCFANWTTGFSLTAEPTAAGSFACGALKYWAELTNYSDEKFAPLSNKLSNIQWNNNRLQKQQTHMNATMFDHIHLQKIKHVEVNHSVQHILFPSVISDSPPASTGSRWASWLSTVTPPGGKT